MGPFEYHIIRLLMKLCIACSREFCSLKTESLWHLTSASAMKFYIDRTILNTCLTTLKLGEVLKWDSWRQYWKGPQGCSDGLSNYNWSRLIKVTYNNYYIESNTARVPHEWTYDLTEAAYSMEEICDLYISWPITFASYRNRTMDA